MRRPGGAEQAAGQDEGKKGAPEKDFHEYLRVDKNNLDTLWERQPWEYMEVAERHTQASMEADRAKDALVVAESEADKAIRTNPQAFGFEKATDKMVEALIPVQEKVRAAKEKFLQARYNVAILGAARDAMGHRRDALEALTRLWHDGYWAEQRPKAGEEAAGRAHAAEQASGLSAGMAGKKFSRPS